MKTLRTLLTVILLAGATMMNAQRMSYDAMSRNARFLTDRMAYTLGVTSMAIIDDIYRINFDYIYGVNDYLDDVAMGYYYDDYNLICARRDNALRYLLGEYLWNRLVGYTYFHRPIVFHDHRWHFSVYDYDHYGHHYFHYGAPTHYSNHYAGGHFFGGMPPRTVGHSGHVGDHNHGYSGPVHHNDHNNNYGAPGNNSRPQGGSYGGSRPQGGSQGGNYGNSRPQGGMNGGGSRSQSNANSSSRQGGATSAGTRGGGNAGGRSAGSGRR